MTKSRRNGCNLVGDMTSNERVTSVPADLADMISWLISIESSPSNHICILCFAAITIDCRVHGVLVVEHVLVFFVQLTLDHEDRLMERKVLVQIECPDLHLAGHATSSMDEPAFYSFLMMSLAALVGI